jgi:hypothetical protein
LKPSSGPGAPSYPGTQYIDAISKLNRFDNVLTVGYVNTEHGFREKNTVNDEVATYAAWSDIHDLAVHGIFFDQTPSNASLETHHYLRNISTTVKDAKGLLEPRMVLQNPGRTLSANLMMPEIDVTIIFEGRYDDLSKHEITQAQLPELLGPRDHYGYLLHSVPSDISKGRLRKIINNVRKSVQYLFVTDSTEKYHERLGSTWWEFLNLTW